MVGGRNGHTTYTLCRRHCVERRTRLHLRSIHVLAYSPIVANYCMTGSADGDIRVWVSPWLTLACARPEIN
jgi:hypothetical protein